MHHTLHLYQLFHYKMKMEQYLFMELLRIITIIMDTQQAYGILQVLLLKDMKIRSYIYKIKNVNILLFTFFICLQKQKTNI